MENFEIPGQFYLGKTYDVDKKKTVDGLVLYDSKDLTTHAVCVGMTGSGKTGLMIGLLEEAAIDGIPAIIIDPKGDMGNLALTFPDFVPSQFLPWVETSAREQGTPVEAIARKTAETWKQGLADWGQSPERVAKFKNAAEVCIYTPGSTAGMPISVLKSFDSPPPEVLEDSDAFAELVGTTVSGILGLVGITVDPVKSREHILLSTLFGHFWKQGIGLDLPALIKAVQKPPFETVGAFDLESFYSSKDRFELALQINNLLASPNFSAWRDGEPFDVDKLLRTESGKPKLSIFSIAHLADPERMFFVSLLLSRMIGWMRKQSGTSSLRAILYFDELFGYMPPVANPPSKKPLLTILKQGRAFGLGTVLATQNPVDLDYKGLANTGTWFIGRLQTERDRERMLDGLASAEAGKFDRGEMSRLIQGLGSRVFLLNNVHENRPEVFQSRWTLSYLAGPMTREQIKRLYSGIKIAGAKPSTTPKPVAERLAGPPAVGPEIQVHYLPAKGIKPKGGRLSYKPFLWGSAEVRMIDSTWGVDASNTVQMICEIMTSVLPVDWDQSKSIDVSARDLADQPEADAEFENLPGPASDAKRYAGWKKDFESYLARTQSVTLFKIDSLKLVSGPGETEAAFRARLGQKAREERDAWIEKLRSKYDTKTKALETKIRTAEDRVEREAAEAKRSQLDTAVSIGATLLGAFLGRKTFSQSTIGRAGSAARSASRSVQQAGDVGRAKENLEALKADLDALDQEFKAEVESHVPADPSKETLQTVAVYPKKGQIAVQLIALVWAPYWVDAVGKTMETWG